MPFRRAHEHIGKAVRVCMERACELQDLSLEELHAIAPEFASDFYQHLTLPAVLGCHNVLGGTGPVRVKAAQLEAAKRLQSLEEELHACAQSHSS